MSVTVSGALSTTLTLSDPATDNPVTVTSTGLIHVISATKYAAGILGTGGALNITNLGTLESTGDQGLGVDLQSGGVINNGSTGLIVGSDAGVLMSGGAGTVSNLGSVSAVYFDVYIKGGLGTVSNLGKLSATGGGGVGGIGVALESGGGVTNGSAGSIAANADGVFIGGGIGTVSNLGTVSASSSTGSGVYLGAGGSVTNGHSGSSAGLISGGQDGVYVTGGAGTVANFGTIAGSSVQGIYLKAGGRVTNGQGGLSDGLISGQINGIGINGTTAGTVANFGTIEGASSFGVVLGPGGSVTNGAAGSIDASIRGGNVGVSVFSDTGAIKNFGVISGALTGVELQVGGSITNNRYALISGGFGVSIERGGTVTDAGVINGIGGTAIQFNTFGSYNDRLVLDPTAAIFGKADGGTGNNTLELRGGATAGTLSGLGSSFVNFGTVTVDPGANWTLAVANLAGVGLLTGSGGANRLVFQSAGTIDLSGVYGFPMMVLANNGDNSTTLHNLNFAALSSPVITVTGGDFGNTVDASALTGANRVTLTGGLRADRFAGGAGNDIFKFSAANLSNSDTAKGGGGSNELLMTTAGTITAGGVSGVEAFKLANGGANHLTVTSANFTGVAGGKITVADGNSGNTVSASTLPSSDAIIIHAGTGTDTLKGGAGNDIFVAGGKTKMTGGAGKNQFTFAHIGTNTITDFATSSTNEIAFSNSGFALGLSGAPATP